MLSFVNRDVMTRYNGGGVGHVDTTYVEEVEYIEPEDVVGSGRASFPDNLIEFDDFGDGSSGGEEDSDEGAANFY